MFCEKRRSCYPSKKNGKILLWFRSFSMEGDNVKIFPPNLISAAIGASRLIRLSLSRVTFDPDNDVLDRRGLFQERTAHVTSRALAHWTVSCGEFVAHGALFLFRHKPLFCHRPGDMGSPAVNGKTFDTTSSNVSPSARGKTLPLPTRNRAALLRTTPPYASSPNYAPASPSLAYHSSGSNSPSLLVPLSPSQRNKARSPQRPAAMPVPKLTMPRTPPHTNPLSAANRNYTSPPATRLPVGAHASPSFMQSGANGFSEPAIPAFASRTIDTPPNALNAPSPLVTASPTGISQLDLLRASSGYATPPLPFGSSDPYFLHSYGHPSQYGMLAASHVTYCVVQCCCPCACCCYAVCVFVHACFCACACESNDAQFNSQFHLQVVTLHAPKQCFPTFSDWAAPTEEKYNLRRPAANS